MLALFIGITLFYYVLNSRLLRPTCGPTPSQSSASGSAIKLPAPQAMLAYLQISFIHLVLDLPLLLVYKSLKRGRIVV